jgi:proteasome-associated ATPase
MGSVALIGKIDLPPNPMAVMKVAEIRADGRILVEMGPEQVIPLHKCSLKGVEVGDRLVVGGPGPFLATAIENLGKSENRFRFNDELKLSWEDVGGQIHAKAQLKEAIEFPILYKDLYKSLGKKQIKGVLLEGPPGCGKTLLAKAAAASISRLYGKAAASTGYIYVKGPEVLSKWVGEAESTIRGLFNLARSHKQKHGYPAILFIDECESLLSRRGSGVSSDMDKTIVPSFLAELDGLTDSGAMVILATNRPDRLDSAVVREGRIDRRIRVDRPNQSDAAQIFQIYLGKVPTCSDPQEVSNQAAEHLFSAHTGLVQLTTTSGDTFPFTLGHLASGAMIEGIVDRSTSLVLHEAIEKKATKKAGMLGLEHVKGAIAQIREVMQTVDYGEDIKTFVANSGLKLKGISQL